MRDIIKNKTKLMLLVIGVALIVAGIFSFSIGGSVFIFAGVFCIGIITLPSAGVPKLVWLVIGVALIVAGIFLYSKGGSVLIFAGVFCIGMTLPSASVS